LKHLLIILTNNRVNEKTRSIIPELSKYYKLTIYNIGEMSKHTKWYGDIDPRIKFRQDTDKYIYKVIDGEGLDFHGDGIKSLMDYISLDDYDGILYDDNRIMPELQLPLLYQEAKKKDIPVIGNSHGNWTFEEKVMEGLGKVYDYQFVLGKKEKLVYKQISDVDKLLLGGIPSNDKLKYVERNNDYILVITNFLGNHPAGRSIYPNFFDKFFVEKTGLIELSEYYKLPIVVKQKTRLDDDDYEKNINYIKECFPSNVNLDIVTDCDDICGLVCNSHFIVSALSTLCFKPIQKGVPIAMIKGSGFVGNFYDSNSLCELDKSSVHESIEWQIENGKDIEFIETTVEGGLEFNSTEKYIESVKNII
tara:strand:+ start:4106 stop:5194 length:1089 start_codon:yes stop_codon:yes gene_type:complete